MQTKTSECMTWRKLHGTCDQLGFLLLILVMALAMCLVAEAVFWKLG